MAVSEQRNPIEALAEEFLERYRSGERPSLTEYTQQHPDLADKIRELFPTLVMMEEIGPGKVEHFGAYQGSASADGKPLSQLGEYRIVREIGRGGMGLVYEAVQESLGRHVALKVLPYRLAADSTSLARFQCEARAAAHLHHTNIVPVFDVGVHDGVYYFAMQYIQGQSLDEVLMEVRRMRKLKSNWPQLSPTGSTSRQGPELCDPSRARNDLTGRLAGGMASGQFVTAHAENGDSGQAAISTAGRSTNEDTGSVSSSAHSELSSSSDYQYCRSVARIGVQVADALAYAHGQKVLHRDIKPANLLLDLDGTVWVTDFGLAKEETSDLTKTGDVVGTLRYMAPERFDGAADARSDVFSLGLTLYELLTLRPAFDESDRTRLIKQVTHEDPPRPRAVDPRIPRDLETIVLKSIAKDRLQRYSSATALVEDLRRFLSDRPILARRAKLSERCWRWARRNPGWAATLATAFALLLIIALGGGLLSVHLGRALSNVQSAEADKTEKLWQSYLERARAERASGRVGQRFEALKAIRLAARIRTGPELRNEAVAALVLPDVELHREWEGWPEDTLALAFDARFKRYARISKKGEITVCRATADGEEVLYRLPVHGQPPYYGLWISEDGHYLAYGHSCTREAIAGGVRVWRLDGLWPKPWLDVSGMYNWALAFHSSGRKLAIGHPDQTLSVYDLDTRRRLSNRPLEFPAHALEFHPRDSRLAVACGTTVRLFNTETGLEMPALSLEKASRVTGMAWHPDGLHLAAGYRDLKIRIWNTETAAEAMTPWKGCVSEGIRVRFNHAGDRLLSDDWSGQTRLWDAVSGQMLLSMQGYYGLQFSHDDTLVGPLRVGNKIRINRMAHGKELKMLRRRLADEGEQIFSPIAQDDGQVVAAATFERLIFFDLETGKELASIRLPEGACFPRAFDADGGWLTCGSHNTLLWPAKTDPARPALLRVGPPRRLAAPRHGGASASRDGRWLAVPMETHAIILDRDHPDQPRKLGTQYDVRHCAMSPDGAWAVSCSWWSDGRSSSARVWDARTGRHVGDLPLLEMHTTASFSPDGAWLATRSTPHGVRIWEVGSWRKRFHFGPAQFAFGADGSWLLTDELGAIRMLESGTGRELVRFTGPEATLYTPYGTTADGARLIAGNASGQALFVWDLRWIREQLGDMGLDWDEASLPQPRVAKTRQVEIVPGPLLTLQPGSVVPDPKDFEAWLRRGLSTMERAQQVHKVRDREELLRSAAGDFTQVIALQPKHSAAYKQRGMIYLELQDYARALADLQKAADGGAESAIFYNNLAWHYVTVPAELRDPNKALALVQRALRLRPGYATILNTLGVVYYRLDRLPEAIRALEASRKAGYDELTAFDAYFLAMAHHRLGNAALAKEYLERAIRWHESPPRKLTLAHGAELDRHRQEAETLFAVRRDH